MSDLEYLQSNCHTLESKQVLAELGTDDDFGLSDSEVLQRQEKYGKNQLPPPEPTAFWKLVLKQFEDTLVLILLGAAVVSFILALFEEGEDRLTAFFEPAVILIILIANAAVGVIQETNAEKSIEALRQSEARDAHVIRNRESTVVHANSLVPGDIVVVSVGDRVPADGRIIRIETATLQVDESLLTGEVNPVQKHTDPIRAGPDIVTGEKRNLLFSGTLVNTGKCIMVVHATGKNTAMGDIATDLSGDDDEKTPLQEKLDEFGEQLSKVIAVICVVVWLINIGHFTDPDHGSLFRGAIYYFKIAVALAVAAIPEGLPAVVTTCLALGTMRMAKKNAIVRHLPSVETLGCTTVICSDKTGTLTTNKMSVRHAVVVEDVSGKSAHLAEFTIDGDSFAPYGTVISRDGGEMVHPAAEHDGLAELGKICSLCNESELHFALDPKRNEPTYTMTGTPTEAALKVLSEKLGVPDHRRCEEIFRNDDPNVRIRAADQFWQRLYSRELLLEFTRDRKSMSVVVRENETGRRLLLVKGAPESSQGVRGIFERCSSIRLPNGKIVKMTQNIREQLNAHNEAMAAQEGLRCLGLAYVEDPTEDFDHSNMAGYADLESNMVFVGLVGMLDPPRPEVAESIAKCHRAGVRVIVITGDFKKTAEQICRRIGVFGQNENLDRKSFTGAEFTALSTAQQEDVLRTASLFSRVEPRHKKKLVDILQKQGEIVAMTGDGVNDAPALKKAHIGVAMGSGTDVAREASDMVLQDDNFATIVMAVEEGRSIYANTKQFIRYLISSNIGEVACIFLTAAMGIPEALIPVQLLWVNLVTDGLPATALGFNPPDPDIMETPPRGRDERIINGWMFFRYMVIGIYVGIATVGGFIWWYLYYADGPGITYAQLTSFHTCGHEGGAALFGLEFDCAMFHSARPSTISLSILVTIEMFNALNALSENQSLLVMPPWVNIWVLLAVALSFALHFVIVYVPWFAGIFHAAPLVWDEWVAVLAFSFPVILLDEVLKMITRNIDDSSTRAKAKKNE